MATFKELWLLFNLTYFLLDNWRFAVGTFHHFLLSSRAHFWVVSDVSQSKKTVNCNSTTCKSPCSLCLTLNSFCPVCHRHNGLITEWSLVLIPLCRLYKLDRLLNRSGLELPGQGFIPIFKYFRTLYFTFLSIWPLGLYWPSFFPLFYSFDEGNPSNLKATRIKSHKGTKRSMWQNAEIKSSPKISKRYPKSGYSSFY